MFRSGRTHVEETAEHASTLRKVVCAIDLGPQSQAALQLASDVVRRSGGDVGLAHAIPTIEARPASDFDTDFAAHLSAGARLRVEELQDHTGTNYKVCVHGGNPAEVVAWAAVTQKADLVVIARGAILGGLGRLRTHAYSIINKSPVPVLSV